MRLQLRQLYALQLGRVLLTQVSRGSLDLFQRFTDRPQRLRAGQAQRVHRYLRQGFAACADLQGATSVLGRCFRAGPRWSRIRHPELYRGAGKNLGTQLKRIVERAGLQPWPKIFHNLRASRQTELCNVHPTHVVCEWIGTVS